MVVVSVQMQDVFVNYSFNAQVAEHRVCANFQNATA